MYSKASNFLKKERGFHQAHPDGEYSYTRIDSDGTPSCRKGVHPGVRKNELVINKKERRSMDNNLLLRSLYSKLL